MRRGKIPAVLATVILRVYDYCMKSTTNERQAMTMTTTTLPTTLRGAHMQALSDWSVAFAASAIGNNEQLEAALGAISSKVQESDLYWKVVGVAATEAQHNERLRLLLAGLPIPEWLRV